MSAETTYSAYLEAVGRDLEVAARRQARMARRRRARLRLAAIGLAAMALLAGSALAGAGILGGRAPAFVQSGLSSLWQGDGSRMAPTDGEFREVAIFGDDTLYRAPGRDGTSVCLSIVGSDGKAVARGGIHCFDPGGKAHWPSGVVVLALGGRQAIYGQITAPDDASLVLHRPGADAVAVPLGLDGHFLIEVPLVPAPIERSPAMGTLRIIAGDGSVVDSLGFVLLSGDEDH